MDLTFLIGGELEVRRVGFGAMRIVADRAEGVRVVRRAVELGVTLIDTADIYGAGVSEEVIAEALHPYPDDLVIATKGGLG
jgi:aryl-alcohol dehydrogenase-like predicted oxidoreductase